MKTIGLLGGMSWESTVTYYQVINRTIGERLGKLHSGKILLYSVDFEPIEQLQHAGRWDEMGQELAGIARRLEAAGAEFLVIATNTMHKVAPQVEAAIGIPLLHIADATAEAIRDAGLSTVGLLGTRFTMEQPFLKDRLRDRHGLEVLVPDEDGRETVHRVIYDELCLGRVLEGSRRAFVEIVERLAARGAEGVILGCTEIPMLLGPEQASIALFDTTTIHARKAADWALADAT